MGTNKKKFKNEVYILLRLEIKCITQYNAIQNPKIKNKTLEHCTM